MFNDRSSFSSARVSRMKTNRFDESLRFLSKGSSKTNTTGRSGLLLSAGSRWPNDSAVSQTLVGVAFLIAVVGP